MAKPSFFKLSGRDSQYSLERFWEQAGINDAGITARFFQLFAGRGEGGGAGESAQAVSAAGDRIVTLRAPELAAIAIPASGVAGAIGRSDAGIVYAPAAAGTAQTGPVGGEAEGTPPIATIQLAATPMGGMGETGSGLPAFASDFVIVMSDMLEAVGLYDARTKTLLPGAPGDYPELGQGPDDLLDISGDFSGGFLLGQVIRGLDTIVLRGGNDYNFTTTDTLVESGQTLTISAMPLTEDDHFLFDGSGETDGRFIFFGGRGSDAFIGGAGDDRIFGNEGADILAGGGGADVFGYRFASDSSGSGYDTIGDFDAALDRIDLGTAVSGFATAIEGGTLSAASLDDDLSAALGGLGANQAVWFAPDAGDLAGTIFLVVDANQEAGYQAGEDYVLAIGGAPLVDLTGHTDIFI